jgi:molybdopterin/thiamine biosynthesis adenylyltransferase
MNLTQEQESRYKRQIMLKDVGPEGQVKLLQSKVLIIGTGGLGSPVSYYLTAAGVGTIGLVDFDKVDKSNLHRQIVHSESTIGVPKVKSATESLGALNSEVIIKPYPVCINTENALDIIKDYDVVVDGCDNYETRYLVNAACSLLDKVYIFGAVLRYEGQTTVFIPKSGPCYQCLFPEAPSPEAVPKPSEEGLFGVLPGVIGTIQATETIKLLLGIGSGLIGRLLLYNSFHMKFREIEFKQNPECPICGDKPKLKKISDFKKLCGMK